jgi:copper(I)-binding protein
MTIRNSGERPDALMSATTPTAKTAQLHVSTEEGGVMKMRPIDALEIAPAASVRLEPGHYHIMLLGLSEPLRPGSHFPLVLTFRNGGELSIMVDVLKAGSKGPPSIAIPDKPSTKQETGQ